MEMRKENDLEFELKRKEQVIEFNQLELEDFITGSENGLDLIDENYNITNLTVEEIQNKLNLDNIYEVFYIQQQNKVKLLLNNRCINFLRRV